MPSDSKKVSTMREEKTQTSSNIIQLILEKPNVIVNFDNNTLTEHPETDIYRSELKD